MNQTMDLLWAPWRMKYIKLSKKSRKCVFCKIFNSNKDKGNHVLYRSKKVFVLLNVYPYNNGHLLVVTNRHIGDLTKLTSEEMFELINVMKISVSVIRKVFSPEGFNIGLNIGKIAGAGVKDHIHIHVVPRWSGDTNYMPVISRTKVISELLDGTYKKLIKHFPKKYSL